MSPTHNDIRLPHVLGVRCNWCSKERPQFRVHQLSSGQVICDHCLEWHLNALAFLGGSTPRGCQECDRDWQTLRNENPAAIDVKLYVVQKDGILALLCERCAAAYVPKRQDLYRGTEFGRQLEAAS